MAAFDLATEVDGRAYFENEGSVAIGKLDQGYIVLESWGLTGRFIMSTDSQTIRWNNGKTWFRPRPLSQQDARLRSIAADSPPTR